MPFTPYHFGPASFVGLLLRKYLDLPVFILVNVAVDLEPLWIYLYRPTWSAHLYFHTFLFGSLVGIAFGIIAYLGRRILQRLMTLVRLPYIADFNRMVGSAILGVWFHVLLDAPFYSDIYPFYPLKSNPLYGLISLSLARWLYTAFFIFALYIYLRIICLAQTRH